MELGDSEQALRAKVELAKRHAQDLARGARKQRERARDQLEAEERLREAARASAPAEETLLHCPRCNATWRGDAVREATRRRVGCLVCGGPLTPVP
jgi:hypothetical protein